MKFTYTKFPTENILHIFWVWKIPYKKISYNNLEAYFLQLVDNFTLEAHWRHLELELSGFGFHCSCFYCKLQKHLINLKNKPSGTSLKFSDIFKLSEILRMFDIFRYFPNFQKFPPCLSIIPFKACLFHLAFHKGSH